MKKILILNVLLTVLVAVARADDPPQSSPQNPPSQAPSGIESSAQTSAPSPSDTTVKSERKPKGKVHREKEVEGTQAPHRFESDAIFKSKYELNGQPLEVDTD